MSSLQWMDRTSHEVEEELARVSGQLARVDPAVGSPGFGRR
jgi:hypothetical protein